MSEDPAKRDKAGRFGPGNQANPSGRPKLAGEIRDLLRAAAPRAAERLKELIESPDEKVALGACKEILDRSIGKAPLADEDGEKISGVAFVPVFRAPQPLAEPDSDDEP